MAVNGTNGTAGEQLVGRVEAVNERGVKVDGAWRNLSKWADEVALPRRGQAVTLTLDKSGFIRAIEPAEDAHHSPVAGRDASISRLALVSRPLVNSPPAGPS